MQKKIKRNDFYWCDHCDEGKPDADLEFDASDMMFNDYVCPDCGHYVVKLEDMKPEELCKTR